MIQPLVGTALEQRVEKVKARQGPDGRPQSQGNLEETSKARWTLAVTKKVSTDMQTDGQAPTRQQYFKFAFDAAKQPSAPGYSKKISKSPQKTPSVVDGVDVKHSSSRTSKKGRSSKGQSQDVLRVSDNNFQEFLLHSGNEYLPGSALSGSPLAGQKYRRIEEQRSASSRKRYMKRAPVSPRDESTFSA